MSRAPPTIHASSSAASIAATCEAHALTPEQFAALRSQASAAKAAAYCPYSKFRVGAAVLGDDGSVTTGANVENASYPVGTCAERVALGKAVTDRGLRAFKAVAVATDVAPPASPCGMCRQLLDMPVIMFDKDENFVVLTLEELLPLSFGPEKLGM
ncbi:Cytidine deaminase [Metarhizium anisopliae]